MMEDEVSKLIAQRYEKVKGLREKGIMPYPASDGTEYDRISELRDFEDKTAEELEELNKSCAVAGRIKGGIRNFGSIIFFTLFGRTGNIQVVISKKEVGEDLFKFIDKDIDVGDLVAVSGKLFKTRRGEFSIRSAGLKLLTKTVRPLPEKWHGFTDVEARYRQRYVDLIMNPEVANVFRMRSEIVRLIRVYLNERDFLEVETPMMQPIAGGATARPFQTYHHALDMDLYLRVAPELYLKRLLVGGFERVFEINRNFRNEGISIKHNPEFTMVEFYQAYARFTDLMDLTEEMFCLICKSLYGKETAPYQGQEISYARPWKRLKLYDAVLENTDLKPEDLESVETLRVYCEKHELPYDTDDGSGKLVTIIFDKMVEEKLIQPTFIYDYPTEVSPLARRNDDDPERVDRFELFIAGREIANAFNELNDPEDQRGRFAMQVRAKQRGDKEAQDYDNDYVRALEYGLPPCAGEGIGVDRVVMLMTDCASIRDVILFPLLRKESK